MRKATREQVLVSLMRDVCEEIGVPEEKSERAPILEALNNAYNLGHGHGAAVFSDDDGEWDQAAADEFLAELEKERAK